MKKNEARKLKKLKLSRETLRELTNSDTQKAVGGVNSTPTRCIGTEPEPCDTIGTQ
jgi:hypothetical protein